MDGSLSAVAIATSILSSFTVFLSLVPVVAFMKSSHYLICYPIACVALMSFFRLTNALIWPNADISTWWDGRVFCDIQIKLILGLDAALSASTICIFRRLTAISDIPRDSVYPSQKRKRWNNFVEYSWCIGYPVFIISAHYIIQPERYWVFPIRGCTPSFDRSWPSFPLLLIWRPIGMIVATSYASVAIARWLRNKRRLVRTAETAMLRHHKKRTGWMIIALALIIQGFIALVFGLNNFFAQLQPFSWRRIHPPWWSYLYFLRPQYHPRAMILDLIYAAIYTSLLVWLSIGGFKREPIDMYKKLFKRLVPTTVHNARGQTEPHHQSWTDVVVAEADIILRDTNER